MRESTIENHLVRRVKGLRGEAYKFTSPGRRGVPDRMVLLPFRLPAFVELKAPDGRLRADQKREQERLRALGHEVVTLWSIQQVNEWLDRWAGRK